MGVFVVEDACVWAYEDVVTDLAFVGDGYVCLDDAVFSYVDVSSDVAEASYTRSISDFCVVAYNHVVPYSYVFSKGHVFARYYALSKFWFLHKSTSVSFLCLILK